VLVLVPDVTAAAPEPAAVIPQAVWAPVREKREEMEIRNGRE